jgi:hypothetical protein
VVGPRLSLRHDVYADLTWTTGPVIDGYGVTALDCASPKLCVSGDIQGYVRRFNGTGWGRRVDLSSIYNPIGGYIDSVSCPSAQFCMAGDNSGHSYVSTDGARTWAPGEDDQRQFMGADSSQETKPV